MKYWNKHPHKRKNWHQVRTGPKIWGVRTGPKIWGLKRWAQEYESKGKFFFHTYGGDWWFERKEDAVFFALKWL